MDARQHERRPGQGAASEKTTRPDVATSMASTADNGRDADPVDFLGIVSGAYAVAIKVDGEHHRRRLFMTLAPAERAAARARARGQAAEVVLVRLEAVGVVPVAAAEAAS